MTITKKHKIIALVVGVIIFLTILIAFVIDRGEGVLIVSLTILYVSVAFVVPVFACIHIFKKSSARFPTIIGVLFGFLSIIGVIIALVLTGKWAKENAQQSGQAITPTPAEPQKQSIGAMQPAMDAAFVSILQRMAAERGFSIFKNFAKCKSLLQDYTADKYKKESRLLLLAIEAGCPVEIARSTEPEITQERLIDKLQDEFSMNQTAAEQIVALLSELYMIDRGTE